MLCLFLSPIQTTFVFIHLSSTLTCRISQFIFAVVNHAVFFNILVLAIDRFVAVVFPLRYRLLSQPKWIKFFVSFVWLVSFILNIPMEFNGGVGHYGVDRAWGGCSTVSIGPGKFDYRPIHASLAIYLPVALIMTGLLHVHSDSAESLPETSAK